MNSDYVTYLEKQYRDSVYKEVDGIYIIYQGYVDIVDPHEREKIGSIPIFENFGESKPLQSVSYEYFGDLYAGLNPANPNRG